jgi:hypothetical protein
MLTFKELGRYGRLGNQMFQIASTIGLATRHGYSFGFPDWMNWDHRTRFGSMENIDIQSYFKNRLPQADNLNYKDYFVQWGYHNLRQLPDNLNLIGHMQSEKYFDHCKDAIRYYFELNELTDIQMPDNAIAIHVRRGDYDDGYHPTMKADYYDKALSYMPDAPVFVFSDSIAEAKQILSSEFTFVEGNHYMIDLQLMTRCTNFILSNSTLCWWGWWLAKRGKCVIPANWFGQVAGISGNDLYTNEQIVI